MVSDFNPTLGKCSFFFRLAFRIVVRIEDFVAGAEHLRVKNCACEQENKSKGRDNKVSASFIRSLLSLIKNGFKNNIT